MGERGYIRITSDAAGVTECEALIEELDSHAGYRVTYKEMQEGMQGTTTTLLLDVSDQSIPTMRMSRHGDEVESLQDFVEGKTTKAYYKVASSDLTFAIETHRLFVFVVGNRVEVDVEAAFLFSNEQPLPFIARLEWGFL